MVIRDRGKIKWQPASFMPEAFAMTREMFKDEKRQAKPLIDEYETEEFDQRIAYAMESKLAVKLTVWEEGFTEDITGKVHYVDLITKQLRFEVKPGEFERVAFDKVVGVAVVD
ncbi:YolD-like family protein [Neobacillus sp. 179-C4.2 HS]|uniref:YolD-like family protein n=1 Tax=Neobacillus driksii TaxID=3035913 RepID=A0ABV4YQM3_9BACI|nr:YolD-like family protein [Neobacillus sp. 179.-C4.2 HS]MDP5197167.1 YolD-like family protein [Neobacillus sp. 179.-C4.2 HS]